MLRSEIQEKTGLSRKALEYYEEKGLISPQKLDNGYRNYSDEDLKLLRKISIFRKLGMTIGEIEEILSTDYRSLASVLRRKEHEIDIGEQRKDVLNLIINGEKEEIINDKIAIIESEETIYEKLEQIFPGYFGQMLFASYKPFLNESLDNNQINAFEEYVRFLDQLPEFNLTEGEKDYIEKISSIYDMKTIDSVVEAKIYAIENSKSWVEANKEMIEQYEEYKNSEEYENSEMKTIQDKLKEFMIENNYYEIAIPLIREFSKSYDKYYKQLLKANDDYLKYKV